MSCRDLAIRAVTVLGLCATVATSPPLPTSEGFAAAEIEIPAEGLTQNVAVTLTYTGDTFAYIDINLDVLGVGDEVTLTGSVNGILSDSVTSTSAEVEILGLSIEVPPCPLFEECTRDAAVAVRLARADAPSDADVRNVSLRVLGAIGVSEGPGSNTNTIEVSFVP